MYSSPSMGTGRDLGGKQNPEKKTTEISLSAKDSFWEKVSNRKNVAFFYEGLFYFFGLTCDVDSNLAIRVLFMLTFTTVCICI